MSDIIEDLSRFPVIFVWQLRLNAMPAVLPIPSRGGRLSEQQVPKSVAGSADAMNQPAPVGSEHANPVPALFVPEYAAPLQAELTHNQQLLAKLATAFGALPLTLGCIDFLLWIPTRAHIFEFGGLLIILLGLL